MGRAVARRLGAGRRLLIADLDNDALRSVAADLSAAGHDVSSVELDVSDAGAVAAFAERAGGLGAVRTLVHTAGLSPVQATADAIIRVDLLGVALVLDEFAKIIAPGGAGVVISSMAGHLAPTVDPEDEQQLARTPSRELLSLPALEMSRHTDPGLTYAFAKRANQIRVRAASVEWGRCGARLNSISPGIIATPMGRAELQGPNGSFMRALVEQSGCRRLGTPDDLAAVIEFLVGSAASFITGVDLLVDGGVVAALTTDQVNLG